MDQLGSWADPYRTQLATGVHVGGRAIPSPIYEVARIHFRTNEGALDARDRSRLEHLANAFRPLLTGAPRPLTFYIVGFADERGTDHLNLALSADRAQAVADCFRKALLPGHPTANVRVTFVVQGRGKVREPASSPLVRRAGLSRAESLGPPSRWQALARWRRVSVYSNVSGAPVKAGIFRLRTSLRKAAETATTRLPQQLENLRELVETYRGRVGRGLNTLTDHNMKFLAWYETRLRERERQYEALKRAVDAGDEAFLRWMDQSVQPYADFVQEVTDRLRKEIERLRGEKATAPPAKKAVIEDIIGGLEADIEFLLDEAKAIEPMAG